MKPVILRSALIGAAALVATATLPLAGGHSPVEMREAAMKANGKSAKTISDMLKGTTDFDAEAANAALADMAAAMTDFHTYFPEGTALAGENENAASEAIWTDAAGFEAALAEFRSDIDGAVAAAPQTKEALAASFGSVAENCKACHEDYRVKK